MSNALCEMSLDLNLSPNHFFCPEMESADLSNLLIPVNQTSWYHIVSEKLPIPGKVMKDIALRLRYYFSYERECESMNADKVEGPLWETRMIFPFCSVERQCMIT
jgi:hypothetical protein